MNDCTDAPSKRKRSTIMGTYRPVGLLLSFVAGVCNLLTRPDTIPPLSRIPRPSNSQFPAVKALPELLLSLAAEPVIASTAEAGVTIDRQVAAASPPSSSQVRTPAFQAGDTGSNPVGGTNSSLRSALSPPTGFCWRLSSAGSDAANLPSRGPALPPPRPRPAGVDPPGRRRGARPRGLPAAHAPRAQRPGQLLGLLRAVRRAGGRGCAGPCAPAGCPDDASRICSSRRLAPA